MHTTRKTKDTNGGRADYLVDGKLVLRVQTHHSAGVLQSFSIVQPEIPVSGRGPFQGWVLLAPHAPVWASRVCDAWQQPPGKMDGVRLPGRIVGLLGRDEYGRVIAQGPSDGRGGYAGARAMLQMDPGVCHSMLADLDRWCTHQEWTSAAAHAGLLAEHEGTDLASALSRDRVLALAST